jgi:ERCC4-type nuclease
MSPVMARCLSCEDKHPLGVRGEGFTTTECPSCDSTSYTSKPQPSEFDDMTVRAFVEEYCADVDGVGAVAVDGLVAEFRSIAALRSASIERLAEADGVGQQNGRNVRDALAALSSQ